MSCWNSLKKYFFHTLLEFTKFDFIKGTYTSEEFFYFNGFDKINLKSDFFIGVF